MSRSGMTRGVAAFASMTLISRVAGFVREWLQLATFGASPAAAAFVVAYRIPNYLRRIFAEGSFSSAFVPVLTELEKTGDKAAVQDFLDHVAGALLAAVTVVTALGMLGSPWIARLFLLFAGEGGTSVALVADMLRVTFPYLMFISMTALAGGVLNSLGRFGLPAFTPVLHNLMVIIAIVALGRVFDVPEFALAWGVFAAGVAQFLLLWPALGRAGLRPRWRWNPQHAGVRKVFGLMLPTIFSSTVSQLNLLVGTMAASALLAQAQVWLYASDRLVELPLGLFGVAIGTVILPHLSGKHAVADSAGFSKSLDWGLRLVLLVGLPAALGLGLLAEPVAATLFQHGRFTAEDARMTAWAVMAMCVGVPAFMLSKVLLAAFYARQDTRTPMRAAVATVVVNVVLIAAFTLALKHGGFLAPHAGIALATALAGIVNAALLWRALHREGLYRPQPGWGRFAVQLGVAALMMVATLLGLKAWLGEFGALVWQQRLVWLPGFVAAGAAAYGLTLLALGLRPRQILSH